MKTTQEKCIIVAEKCGWKFVKRNKLNRATLFADRWKAPDGCYYPDLSYFNSLDSIRAAVLSQDEEFQREFNKRLFNKCTNINEYSEPTIWKLTALDWLDCFVETVEALRGKK